MAEAAQRAAWVPDWVYQSVIYHIYPLGYLGAPISNSLQGKPVDRLSQLSDWYEHLTTLGIDTVYFGPLFESHSHGYDIIDYFQVDRRLGTIEELRNVVDELHARDIRVILEGVFNHTGRGHFAFQDILRNRENSAYAHWYHINWHDNNGHNDGFSYATWEGHERLPKLNHRQHDVREHLFDVAKYWMEELDIDGWRLDVAYEIETEFWWHFRRVCKHINPRCFLFGEMFYGNYRDLVNPEHLDSATNYHLYSALTTSFNNENFWELKSALERLFGLEYGVFQDLPLINFLGNHDVSRILDVLPGDRHVYPAMIALMTIPGVPAIYYGDEVGMRGHKSAGDHALRRPMVLPSSKWPDAQENIFRELSRLVQIRRDTPALTHGAFSVVQTSQNLLSYVRLHPNQTALVVLSNSIDEQAVSLPLSRYGIRDGTTFVDHLNQDDSFTVRNGRLHIDVVWPSWGRVLVTSLD